MSNITVPVPEDRTAEFYRFFGLWLDGELSLDSNAGTPAENNRREWDDTPQDLEDARWLWKKFSTKARELHNILIDNPNQEYTGTDLANRLGIPHGSRGVAGTLAWPGRYSVQIGRDLPTDWNEEGNTYWMTPKVANLFRRARNNA